LDLLLNLILKQIEETGLSAEITGDKASLFFWQSSRFVTSL
jgi:hypothetical protein